MPLFAAAALAVVIAAIAVSLRWGRPTAAARSGGFSLQPATRAAAAQLERAARATPSGLARTVAANRVQGVVQSADRRPLPRASVCLVDAEHDKADVACAVTGVSGRFAFEDVPSSVTSVLSVSALGYVPMRQPLAACMATSGGHDLRITLVPGGSVVSGTVIDAGGGPVVGALVSARSAAEAAIGAAMASGDDGAFQLAVPVGPLVLRVRADAYSEASLTLREPRRDVTLVLAPASEILGTVTAAGSGEAVADAVVTATNTSGLRAPPRIERAGADGRFRFSSLPSGRYELSAVASAWRTVATSVEVAVGERSEGVLLVASPAVPLRASVDVSGMPCSLGSVELDGPASVTRPIQEGEVVFDGLWPGRYLALIHCSTGPALPDGETPGVGAEETFSVELEPAFRAWHLVQAAEDGSDDRRPSGKGRIRVAIDPPGRGSTRFTASLTREGVRAAHRGYLDDKWIVFDDLSPGTYDVFLDQAPGNIVQVLLDEAGQQRDLRLTVPEGVVISGQVVDENRDPVPDAWVRAYHSKYALGDLAAAGVPVLTSAEGTFTISGLLDGMYDLDVDSPAGQAHVEGVQGGRQNVHVSLVTFGTLFAVVQTRTDEPLQSFVVTYRRREDGVVRRSNGSQGVWALPSALPGAYDILVSADSGGASARVLLEPGAKIDVRMTVDPALAALVPEFLSATGPAAHN